MERRMRRSRRGKNRKMPFLMMILFLLALSTLLLTRYQVPSLFEKVMAGGMVEEDLVDNRDSNESTGILEGDPEEDPEEGSNNEDLGENQLTEEGREEAENKEHIDYQKPTGGEDDILMIVNKKIHLDPEYKPDDLVIPEVRFSFDGEHEKKYMRQEAAKALEELFYEASTDGVYLFAVSGYRSYNTQKRIFNNKVNSVGEEEANKLVARPGESEHQTGLAMDISSQSVGFNLSESFGQSPEGKWVRDNAHRFGFIIRYPEGKTHITGYSYEPWHIRYVGEDLAKIIYESDTTLEEYFEIGY